MKRRAVSLRQLSFLFSYKQFWLQYHNNNAWTSCSSNWYRRAQAESRSSRDQDAAVSRFDAFSVHILLSVLMH